MLATYNLLYSAVRDLPVVDWHNHLDLRVLISTLAGTSARSC